MSWVESQVWTAVERGPTRGLDGLITIRRQRGTRDYYWEVVLVDVERIESGSCGSLRGAKTKARVAWLQMVERQTRARGGA